MRRWLSCTLLAALIVTQTGCVVALGNRGGLTVPCCNRTAVAVDGEVYIVDLDKATKCRVEDVVDVTEFRHIEVDEDDD